MRDKQSANLLAQQLPALGRAERRGSLEYAQIVVTGHAKRNFPT